MRRAKTKSTHSFFRELPRRLASKVGEKHVGACATQRQGLGPVVLTYDALISADETQRRGMGPRVFTYNAMTGACETQR